MTENLVKKVKVAVYGSLRKGLHNHSLLEGETFVGQFETDPEFSLIDLGSFPGLLKDGHTAVLMEVYEVDATKLKRLDGLEGYRGKNNNNFYNREKIESPFGPLFTYFYNQSSELIKVNIISTGDWADYMRTKKIRSFI